MNTRHPSPLSHPFVGRRKEERREEKKKKKSERKKGGEEGKERKGKGEKGRHGVHGSVADWPMARVRVFSLPSDLPSLSF